jgi:hypothetical protein
MSNALVQRLVLSAELSVDMLTKKDIANTITYALRLYRKMKPRKPKADFRRFDGKTPAIVHNLGTACLALQEQLLDQNTRIVIFFGLLFGDLVEDDDTIQIEMIIAELMRLKVGFVLSTQCKERIEKQLCSVNIQGGFPAEEHADVGKYTDECLIDRAYDKWSNLNDDGWMDLAEHQQRNIRHRYLVYASNVWRELRHRKLGGLNIYGFLQQKIESHTPIGGTSYLDLPETADHFYI